jgi:hypothetical protein
MKIARNQIHEKRLISDIARAKAWERSRAAKTNEWSIDIVYLNRGGVVINNAIGRVTRLHSAEIAGVVANNRAIGKRTLRRSTTADRRIAIQDTIIQGTAPGSSTTVGR